MEYGLKLALSKMINRGVYYPSSTLFISLSSPLPRALIYSPVFLTSEINLFTPRLMINEVMSPLD